MEVKGPTSPLEIFCELMSGLIKGELSFHVIFGMIVMGFILSIPCIVLGWVIQSIIVVIVHMTKHKRS